MREQQIVVLYYYRGMTQAQIGQQGSAAAELDRLHDQEQDRDHQVAAQHRHAQPGHRRPGDRLEQGKLRPEIRARFTAALHGLGVPRPDAKPDLPAKRPNIPLKELTGGRAERLLSLVDRWIDDVRAHAAEPDAK